jgi:anti-sigma B factor antagonist
VAATFQLQRTISGGLVTLGLEGYLDAHTAPAFEKAVQQEIDAGNMRLIADCTNLTYISSAGLGVFMSFIEDIRAAGGDLKICGLQPKVAQVFEVLGFESIFEIVPTAADAAKKFESSTAEA